MLLGTLIVFWGILAISAAGLPENPGAGRLQASLWGSVKKLLAILTDSQNQPAISQQASAINSIDSLSAGSLGQGGPETGEENQTTDLPITQDSALIGSNAPMSDENNGIITFYEVREGDTPSSIAAKFNISVNTLLWANDLRNANLIKVGDNLIILPVSGIKYTVKKGDTLAAVAKKYTKDTDIKGVITDIINYNNLADESDIKIGDEIIIPDGIMPAPPAASPQYPKYSARVKQYASLPDLGDYFITPTIIRRITQGFHGKNGVDIANSIGTPIYAAASGIVKFAAYNGYNGGFGKFIIIDHPNGTQTLYGHASTVFVRAGQQVERGDLIALMGSTGRSTGPHLHFEVHGARNPLLKY